MATKISLSVPQPCHENWNDMTPTQKGSFCASCCKEVIDFTDMTDVQLAAFFKKPLDSTCGRFRAEQLHKDLIVQKKALPWVRYFFQISLPAFLLSLKVGAQQTQCVPTFRDTTGQLAGIKGVKMGKLYADNHIKGKVVDDAGSPIPNVSIIIKGTKQGTVTDAEGKFDLRYGTLDPINLIVSSIGYESREIMAKDSFNTIVLFRSLGGTLGGVVVVVGYTKRKKVPLMQRLSDTVFTKFKIYPNPVQAGRKIIVEWKGEKGNYITTLINLTGQVLLTKEVKMESKYQLVSVDVPVVAPGMYALSFRNQKTGKIYSQQLQVQ